MIETSGTKWVTVFIAKHPVYHRTPANRFTYGPLRQSPAPKMTLDRRYSQLQYDAERYSPGWVSLARALDMQDYLLELSAVCVQFRVLQMRVVSGNTSLVILPMSRLRTTTVIEERFNKLSPADQHHLVTRSITYVVDPITELPSVYPELRAEKESA